MSIVRGLSFFVLACSCAFASSAEAGWKYRANSRIAHTPTGAVAAPAEGSISSSVEGSSAEGSGFPSTLQLNTKGWARASDNEAFFSETGQTAQACSISDTWDWVPTGEEPAQGEIEDDMQMQGSGWLDLVNGEAAGKLVLAMKYENSLGISAIHATTLARSTESRSVFAFELEVALPLGSGNAVTVTIPINIGYDVGETLYRADPILERHTSQGCAQYFTRQLKMSSNLEVFADGWFLDMAASRVAFEGVIVTTTHGQSCPQ